MTRDDLLAPVSRWTSAKKFDLVAAVRFGIVSFFEVRLAHGVTADEVLRWRWTYEHSRHKGLQATRQTPRRPRAPVRSDCAVGPKRDWRRLDRAGWNFIPAATLQDLAAVCVELRENAHRHVAAGEIFGRGPGYGRIATTGFVDKSIARAVARPGGGSSW